MTDSITEPAGVSRRTVLAVSAAGAGTLALAACSAAPQAGGGAAGGSSGASSGAGSSSTVLVALSEVAVGSSVLAKGGDGTEVLVTRTAQNSVVAFSSVCPHQGCTVAASFQCPCHGSAFDPKTGARLSGPAPTGLTPVAVAISGSNIVTT